MKAAVALAIGRAVLERDDRGDGVVASEVRDIDAFDAYGRPGQGEPLADLLQARLHVLARARFLLERVRRVFHRHPQEAHFLAALRLQQRDATAALFGQQLLETARGLDRCRHQDFVRHEAAARVVLGHERRDQLVIRQAHVLEPERSHADHAPAAHQQHREFDLVGVARVAEHILIDVRDLRDALCLLRGFDGAQLIAVRRGQLVAQLDRGLIHRVAQVMHEFVVAAFEEESDAAHLLGVFVLRDVEHARPGAALDLILQARPLARFEVGVAAGAQAEVTVDKAQRRARSRRRMIGPEIARAVFLRLAHDLEPRPGRRLVQAQRQELLVVAQLDVVARLQLLDQRVLEQRGFLLAGRDVALEIADLVLQAFDEEALIAGALLKIAAHAALQAGRLAHVQHRARAVFEDVHARRRRQRVELAADGFGEHAANVKEPRRLSNRGRRASAQLLDAQRARIGHQAVDRRVVRGVRDLDQQLKVIGGCDLERARERRQ